MAGARSDSVVALVFTFVHLSVALAYKEANMSWEGMMCKSSAVSLYYSIVADQIHM